MAGASGYLLKRIGSERLLQAVATISRWEPLLDPGITETVQGRIKAVCEGASSRDIDSLTYREKGNGGGGPALGPGETLQIEARTLSGVFIFSGLLPFRSLVAF